MRFPFFFVCYDGFPVDDSIFFCQLKLIIILCQTKKGAEEETLWSFPTAACWLFSGSNHDDLATLQKTRMSRAEKMVIFSTHFLHRNFLGAQCTVRQNGRILLLIQVIQLIFGQKSLRKIHLISVPSFFLMLPFNFEKGKRARGPFKKTVEIIYEMMTRLFIAQFVS